MAALSILTLPGNKGKIAGLTSADKLRFMKKSFRIQTLIFTIVKSFKRVAVCEGQGIVDKILVCKAEFSLILPDEIKKYNLKIKMPIASSLLNKPRLVKKLKDFYEYVNKIMAKLDKKLEV